MSPSKKELRYDPETDLWFHEISGACYFECDARSKQSVLLDITGSRWGVEVNGFNCFIDWQDPASSFPERLVDQTRRATLLLLKGRSPTWLNSVRLALKELREVFPEHATCWEELTMDDWYRIWNGCKKKYTLYTLRVLYKQIALDEKSSVMLQRYSQLTSFKIGKRFFLEDVINWNSTTGAFIDEELERIMRFLRNGGDDSVETHGLRILAWSYLHIGKRPLQMVSVAADGLKTVTHRGVTQYFLEVPKVKAQRGRKPELWEMSADLASEILRYSERPEVMDLQQQSGRLLVWDMPRFGKRSRTSTSEINGKLNRFMHTAGLTTQRDQNLPPESLVFNARRARHTVGTQMAFDGAPSEYITRILEHDSPASAKAYIDAVAAMVQTAVDRADYVLGGIFAGLAENYFSGQMTSELTDRSVFLPDMSEGLHPVGSCGLDTNLYGECKKHPFYSCFGCTSFLAYRGCDFELVRAFVQSMLRRWLDAEGQPERSQMIVEFERLYQGILHVERLSAESL